MIECDSVERSRLWAERIRAARQSLGLVPTMGALHAGHSFLIERARRSCDRVAVTIFVNPTQFGEGEDFERYPRTLDQDLKVCRDLGVDWVFTGKNSGPDGVYADGFQTWVAVEELSKPLCGVYRPAHFRGVATVVTLLLNIFHPHRAYFGQKDYQQARLLWKLALDLQTGVEICILPTVRDPDGLALSSRNRYLSPGDRRAALAIPQALREAEEKFLAGEDSSSRLLDHCRSRLQGETRLQLQYSQMVEAMSLQPLNGEPISRFDAGAVLAVAARAGKTRLIDNLWLRSENRRLGRSNFNAWKDGS